MVGRSRLEREKEGGGREGGREGGRGARGEGSEEREEEEKSGEGERKVTEFHNLEQYTLPATYLTDQSG